MPPDEHDTELILNLGKDKQRTFFIHIYHKTTTQISQYYVTEYARDEFLKAVDRDITSGAFFKLHTIGGIQVRVNKYDISHIDIGEM